jgi:GAF domain-containing protein
MPTTQTLIAETFVPLADSLVDDFDIVELLTVLADRCVQLLDASAAGILLADQEGRLQVVAVSSEQARLLELFQLQNHEGPCLDCFSTGQAVVNADLSRPNHWPMFTEEAQAAGFRSVQALPLRLREVVIGTLNVFMADTGVAGEDNLRIAQALADVATIAILQNHAAKESGVVVVQLQRALNSRIAIEQAKGMLAERARIDVAEAFALLRAYCRRHNLQLSVVAAELVDGTTPLQAVLGRS